MSEDTFTDMQHLYRTVARIEREMREEIVRRDKSIEALESKVADLQRQLRRQESASLRDCLTRPAPPIFVDEAEEVEGVPA